MINLQLKWSIRHVIQAIKTFKKMEENKWKLNYVVEITYFFTAPSLSRPNYNHVITSCRLQPVATLSLCYRSNWLIMFTMKRAVKFAVFLYFFLDISSGKKILIADTATCYIHSDYIITSTGELLIDDIL